MFVRRVSMLERFIIGMMAALLVGCQGAPLVENSNIDKNYVKTIRVGKTTKGEVATKLGEPVSKMPLVFGVEQWRYSDTNMTFVPLPLVGGAAQTGFGVTITFLNDVVTDCIVGTHEFSASNIGWLTGSNRPARNRAFPCDQL